MLAPCIVPVERTLVEVEQSSAVAGLLADAISATADALALAAGGVLPAGMRIALDAVLSFVISASADATAHAASHAAFLSFANSVLAGAHIPAFAVTAVSALPRAALHVVLRLLPRRWAFTQSLHQA